MIPLQPFDVLSLEAKARLVEAEPLAKVYAQIGGFNRESGTAEGDVTLLRSNLQNALDGLEETISIVLAERKADEIRAKRWIFVVGTFLILLIVSSIVLQIVSKDVWTSALFSSLSVAGLLYMLYSPVQQIMVIANDRVGLQLIPMAFRVRAVVASTRDDLRQIGADLSNALLQIERDANRHRPWHDRVVDALLGRARRHD
jgi:hypothetical protein